MSNNYVKKFECGELALDLAYANCIYELPLLSFSDMSGSVNLSLIFNQEMKTSGSNPFNITSGYKLNIQKRIFFDDAGVACFQDSNGKIFELIDSNNSVGTYTFTDGSQRIIRTLSGGSGYVLEHPDFSTEKYGSNGYITESSDKYGNKLTYSYPNNDDDNDDDNKLLSITYREGTDFAKTVSFDYYTDNSLYSITYEGNSTTINYGTNFVLVSHYSGVSYGLYSYEKDFTATINGIDGSDMYTYHKKCNVNSNTIILSDWVEEQEVYRTTYKYHDLTYSPYVAHNYVEITDYLGAETRVQFNSGKITYSYEIGYRDVDTTNAGTDQKEEALFKGGRHVGQVKVFRTEDDLVNAQTPYVQKYADGGEVTFNGDGYYSYNPSSSLAEIQEGYFIFSGWVKPNDNYSANNSNRVTISDGNTTNRVECYLAGIVQNKWMFFAVKAWMSSNNVNFSHNIGIDVRDIRVTFQPTYEWSEEKTKYIPLADSFLVPKSGGDIIPLNRVFFSTDANAPDNAVASFNDILRYIINKKKNQNTTEFYYNNCESVVTIPSSGNVYFGLRVGEDSIADLNLNNYYLGTQITTDKYIIRSRIRDDEPNCFLIYETFDENWENISVQKLNEYLDVVSTSADGVTTDYVRNNCFVTSTSVSYRDGQIHTLTNSTSYNEANGTITHTNEFGKEVKYTINPVWGTIERIDLPDGTVITDTYDKDKSVLLSKTFSKNQDSKTNSFGYTAGNLTSLACGTLQYAFGYSNGDITNVSKNGQSMVTHSYTKTDETDNGVYHITDYYPDSSNSVYSINSHFDKYGRLKSVDNMLTNVYRVNPKFDETTGDFAEETVEGVYVYMDVDNSASLLAMSTDIMVGEVSRYKYNSDNQITEKSVTGTNFADKVSNESFTYDKAKRLESHTYTYDTVNSKSVKDVITYVNSDTDAKADNRVLDYAYWVNGARKAYTQNEYDLLKRLTAKKIKISPRYSDIKNKIAYDKTRVASLTDTFPSGESVKIQYTYDECGRVIEEKDGNDIVLKSYTYDSLGQLVRENNKTLDKTFIYEYNGIGNVTAVNSYPYTIGNVSGTPVTTDFGYSNDKLTSFENKAITYNTNGGVATYDGCNYTWSNGKLSSIKKTLSNNARAVITPGVPSFQPTKTYSFSYNANGQRVSSDYVYLWNSGGVNTMSPGEVTAYNKTYRYDSFGRLISESITETLYGDGTAYSNIVYLYDESSMIGFEYTSLNGNHTYYYRRNLQGDVIAIYDASGNKVVEYAYDAWGNCTIASETTDYDLARANPIRYRGYYFDRETGLYYLNARYYNPEWRRFISPDDAAYLDPETPNGLNLYAYCNNDPVNYADPSGHGAIATLLISALLCGVISAGANALGQVVFDDATFKTIQWERVAIAGLSGFASGLIPGSGLATLAVQSIVSSFVEHGLSYIWLGDDFNLFMVAKDATTSFAIGYVFKGLTKTTSKITSKVFIKGENYSQYQHHYRSKGYDFSMQKVYKKMRIHSGGKRVIDKSIEVFSDFSSSFLLYPI